MVGTSAVHTTTTLIMMILLVMRTVMRAHSGDMDQLTLHSVTVADAGWSTSVMGVM